MKYEIKSFTISDEALLTIVDFSENEISIKEVEINHFRPQSLDEINQNILNRFTTELQLYNCKNLLLQIKENPELLNNI